jgi:curved DNA-binding protein CbpA
MLNYYFVLGLSPDASDEDIRNSYLRLVKKHTPEKDPEKFGKVTEAYEALKDKRKRIEMKIFGGLSAKDFESALLDLANSKEVRPRRALLDELFEAEEKAKKREKR